MHRSGPPRKVFRGNNGPRSSTAGSRQDFTVDYDTPPGAFHQSHPSGQPYLPPPPVDGPPHVFTHVPPQFYPYPPPHYGPYPRPPRHYPPQQWGQGYGYQWRGGWRGRGRGRHSSGGRGGRYPRSKWRTEGTDTQSSISVDAYYSQTMFEDPWKDLVPKIHEEPGEATTTPILVDASKNDNELNINVTISSKLGNTASDAGVDGHSDVSPNVDSIIIGRNSSEEPIAQSCVNPSETNSSADTYRCKEGSDVSMVDHADDIEIEKNV